MNCLCGCGEITPIATKTDARRGYKRGEHTKYLPGHVQRTAGKSNIVQIVESNEVPEITEMKLEILNSYADGDAAHLLDARARAVESFTRRSFIELGMICRYMDKRGLWAKLCDPETGVVFHSWEDWAVSALKVSRSSAFSAKAVLEKTQGIPPDELKEMTRRNAVQFARLSTKVQPKLLEKAKTLSEEKFVAEVQEKYPDQLLGKAPAVVQNFSDENNRKHFDEAIAVSMWAYEVTSREDAIANIVAYFLDGKCDRQGYVKQTNRDAYRIGRKTA